MVLLNNTNYKYVANHWLLLASLFFYGYWRFGYLPLLLSSLIANYILSKYIISVKYAKFRKLLVIIGVLGNLSLLIYFKYINFFIENINTISGKNIPTLNVILPLGISFFTFQQIAYLIDCYKKEIDSSSFSVYGLSICFFPHLIAGPIVHYHDVASQFNNNKFDYVNFYKGILLFSIGLIKKIIIADNFGAYADYGFTIIDNMTFITAWVTSLSYTLQLYFDFSAYSDMAIGIAMLFNIILPTNFNSPYKASNIQDFWRRWHMTLSRLIRNYIYIPLGGNRCGKLRNNFNLLMTFLIAGIWHGAGWNFIIWGLLHGTAIIIHNFWREMNIRINYFFAVIITFFWVNICWVYFRAKDVHSANIVIKNMFMLDDSSLLFSHYSEASGLEIVARIIIGLLIVFFMPNSIEIVNRFKFSSLLIIEYIKGLPKRLLAYFMISYVTYSLLFAFLGKAFYEELLDVKIYRHFPIKTVISGVDNKQYDLRSSLLINELFQGDERKIAIVGSSFTMDMGGFVFNYHGQSYKSGTIGAGSNSLIYGIRVASNIIGKMPNLDTIILGISPLNMGPIKLLGPFEGQFHNGLNMLGIKADVDKFSEFSPIKLNMLEFLDLGLNFDKNKYYQIHNFIRNIITRIYHLSSERPKSIKLDINSKRSFYGYLKHKKFTASMDVLDRQNGRNDVFKWDSEERQVFSSLQPEGDIYQAIKNLSILAKKHKIKLIIYDTPTPNNKRAPYIYPTGFLEKYRIAMQQLTNDLHVKYIDCIDFYPWRGEFMDDFVHATPKARKELHKHLIYSIFI